MSDHGNDHQPELSAPRSTLSKRARLQALLFTAMGSLGTTLLMLGMLPDVKMPRAQGE